MEKVSMRITDYFGKNVFNNEAMQEYMTPDTYAELRAVIDEGKVLGLDLANKVAEAMKEWAMDNGATHYTHWFQPLTGNTAEKHDSFISIDKKGNTILEFTGKNLSKGEADASSFPSGGIRATFEARGYTVWDCSSPAFIKRTGNGSAILYIPTAFCSYTGEALDKKTPLLRSMEAINREGVKLLRTLGMNVNRVIASVGGEQEYFLIDKEHYNKRADLKFCGRTLFGAPAPKGQEQSDQYYASIKTRVSQYMAELNRELWLLGITAKTQHNEAAPSQHELAPIFCQANIATDQNQLIMETMKKVAEKFDLACLLHEKPFDGVNGSGKHNNWSITTDTGVNLLKPGKNPRENTLFLLIFTAVISAVDEYADLVRMSAANPGNEHRLGGHEAPPAIISMFIGDDLEHVLDSMEAGDDREEDNEKEYISTGVNYLAELRRDNSDRNRTSPFAFTGNKFEFRMVGSSATLSNPNVILNTIVAEMFSRITTELQAVALEDRERMARDIARRMYSQHKRIIFKGNNYAADWAREARRRGLKVIENCVDAYDSLIDTKNMILFVKHKVMTEKELISRREIYIDTYNKTVNIEAKTMISMVRSEIIPAVIDYKRTLAKTINQLDNVGEGLSNVERFMLSKITPLFDELLNALKNLENLCELASKASMNKKKAIILRDQVSPAMRELRMVADRIERLMPKDALPYPSYADMLFYE